MNFNSGHCCVVKWIVVATALLLFSPTSMLRLKYISTVKITRYIETLILFFVNMSSIYKVIVSTQLCLLITLDSLAWSCLSDVVFKTCWQDGELPCIKRGEQWSKWKSRSNTITSPGTHNTSYTHAYVCTCEYDVVLNLYVTNVMLIFDYQLTFDYLIIRLMWTRLSVNARSKWAELQSLVLYLWTM